MLGYRDDDADYPLIKPGRYYQRREGIMLCYPYEEKRLLKWEPPFIIQPKMDGERCRAYVNQSSTLISSEMNLFQQLPHLNRFLSGCIPLYGQELDGELYTPGMTLEQIHSIASRKVNPHPDSHLLELWIFDVIKEDMKMWDRLYLLKELKAYLECVDSPVHVIPSYLATCKEEIQEIYEVIIKEGYEGIIVRDKNALYKRKRSTQIMKFKPKQFDIYEIVGFEQEVDIYGKPKDSLGALICSAHPAEGTFNVGTGFTHDQRAELWKVRESLPGKVVKIGFQTLTDKGIPRHSAFCEIIKGLERSDEGSEGV